jgi:phage terminase large subunit
MKLNPALKSFWTTKSQIKVLYGGRMSSKTEDTAGVLSFIASKYKVRIACLRRFQNKIDESVYAILKRKIYDDDYLKSQFTVNKSSIESNIGSEFVFMGIQRNLEEIKGLDNIDITWIEEAEKLTREQWNLIRPTILRKDGSFCVLVFNPYLDTDFVYQDFVMTKQDNVLVRHINYNENPFLSKSAIDLIENDKKKLDNDEFNNIYLGMPRQDDDEALIKRKWIYECVDAHKKLNIDITGQYRIGYDVADSGDDANAIVVAKGILCENVEEWKAKEDELRQSALKVYNKARTLKAIINYDSIGVGAGVGSNIIEFNQTNNTRIIANKFNAGAKVDNPDEEYEHNIKNKDYFSNLKAQAWWRVADMFRNTYNAITKGTEFKEDEIISISSNINDFQSLIVELSTPKKDFDNTGKIKVESKKDLAKRDIKSPNKADAFIMAYYIKKDGGLNASMFD